jgi:hypothetical protein
MRIIEYKKASSILVLMFAVSFFSFKVQQNTIKFYGLKWGGMPLYPLRASHVIQPENLKLEIENDELFSILLSDAEFLVRSPDTKWISANLCIVLEERSGRTDTISFGKSEAGCSIRFRGQYYNYNTSLFKIIKKQLSRNDFNKVKEIIPDERHCKE